MIRLIALGVAVLAIAAGYSFSRRFVRGRLRFVDAAQSRLAPWIAGAAAFIVALPLAWLLPLVGAGTAVAFGVGVGMGVAGGADDVRRGTAYQIRAGS
ncbi:MAG: hypothetical protein M3068_01655 [Gemmatimonadota bacterium]|nr:hypothetical protein [Gemmatimonadota bacterium]